MITKTMLNNLIGDREKCVTWFHSETLIFARILMEDPQNP